MALVTSCLGRPGVGWLVRSRFLCSWSLPPPPAPLCPKIDELHRAAFEERSIRYKDPETGDWILTAYKHLKRGQCCGNQCRHCPFAWKNVRHKIHT